MERHFKGTKLILGISLIIVILFVVGYKFTEVGPKKLGLIKQEDIKGRNELIKSKIKDNGNTKKIPVLMYHHILTEDEIIEYNWTENNSILSLENFGDQMDYLHENDFYTLILSELEEFLIEGRELPNNSVLITFDDGYLSNAKYAYPIMKDYGFRGTIFMMGKASENETRDFLPGEAVILSNKEIDKYMDVFEYGSHTYDMHSEVDGKSLLTSSSIEQIKKDIESNIKIYKTGAIAYPYGGYNRKVIKAFTNEGYRLGFTTKAGYINKRSNQFKLNRFGIRPDTDIEKFKDIVNGKLKDEPFLKRLYGFVVRKFNFLSS